MVEHIEVDGSGRPAKAGSLSLEHGVLEREVYLRDLHLALDRLGLPPRLILVDTMADGFQASIVVVRTESKSSNTDALKALGEHVASMLDSRSDHDQALRARLR